jgi:hypothetical protein
MRIMFLPGDHHNTDDVATMDFNACIPIKKKKKKKKMSWALAGAQRSLVGKEVPEYE